jgi:hypothetical protein
MAMARGRAEKGDSSIVAADAGQVLSRISDSSQFAIFGKCAQCVQILGGHVVIFSAN